MIRVLTLVVLCGLQRLAYDATRNTNKHEPRHDELNHGPSTKSMCGLLCVWIQDWHEFVKQQEDDSVSELDPALWEGECSSLNSSFDGNEQQQQQLSDCEQHDGGNEQGGADDGVQNVYLQQGADVDESGGNMEEEDTSVVKTEIDSEEFIPTHVDRMDRHASDEEVDHDHTTAIVTRSKRPRRFPRATVDPYM